MQKITLGASPKVEWWTEFGSPALDDTVKLALANNQRLAAARANLAMADHMVKAARGALYPQVDANAGVERRAYGAYFLGPEAFTFPTFSAYTAGAQLSYDRDVFGGTRRRIESAAADAEAQGEDLRAAQLSVTGAAVTTALQIAATRAQIQVVQAIIVSDQKTLDLVNAANHTGVASRMDVTTAISQLDRDRALLPPLQQQLNLAQDVLAVLVGRSPADWPAPDFDLAQLTLPGDIPLAVPSELVREALRPLGLTAPQFAVLTAVEEDAGVSNAGLARIAFVTPQTMQGILTNLERGGLLTRAAHPRHGRILCNVLTERGDRLLAQARQQVEDVEQLIVEGVGARNVSAFGLALGGCAERLGASRGAEEQRHGAP